MDEEVIDSKKLKNICKFCGVKTNKDGGGRG
jgi:hypothetical protein